MKLQIQMLYIIKKKFIINDFNFILFFIVFCIIVVTDKQTDKLLFSIIILIKI